MRSDSAVILICISQHVTQKWYRAFSLPGQFAPSESASRNLANSLPGHFAPWNFRSLERNGPALLLPGMKVLADFHSLELSFSGTLAPIMFVSLFIYVCCHVPVVLAYISKHG